MVTGIARRTHGDWVTASPAVTSFARHEWEVSHGNRQRDRARIADLRVRRTWNCAPPEGQVIRPKDGLLGFTGSTVTARYGEAHWVDVSGAKVV
jgi:hypothetical protein